MFGSAAIGWIVNGAVPVSANAMVSVPEFAFAARIASRKVHSVASQPFVDVLSAVVFTVNVVAAADARCGETIALALIATNVAIARHQPRVARARRL